MNRIDRIKLSGESESKGGSKDGVERINGADNRVCL